MKIFSWVHGRFHKKSVADEDTKKAENDKVALLENFEALADVCDEWKEGILAIGTLGVDLSKTFHAKYIDNQILLSGQEDGAEEDQLEEDMESSLVLNASKHGFHHVRKEDPSPCDHKVAKPNNGKEKFVVTKQSTDLDIECTEKKSGERTTLAELLCWVDSEKNLLKHKFCDGFDVPHHVTTGTESTKSTTLISKNKNIKRDDSTHPIKKTKRLMRKMLKKKIHPDIAGQKKETVAGIISPVT